MIYANLQSQVPVLPPAPSCACMLSTDVCIFPASSCAQRPDCVLKWYDLSHLPVWLRSVPQYNDNGGGTLCLFAYERQGDAKVRPHTPHSHAKFHQLASCIARPIVHRPIVHLSNRPSSRAVVLCLRCAPRVQTIFEGLDWMYTFNGLKSHSYVPRASKGVMRCDRADRLQATIQGGLEQEGLRPMTFDVRNATDQFVAAVEVMPRILEDVGVAHDRIVNICTAHANGNAHPPHVHAPAAPNFHAHVPASVAHAPPGAHAFAQAAAKMLPPPPAPLPLLPSEQAALNANQAAAAPAPAQVVATHAILPSLPPSAGPSNAPQYAGSLYAGVASTSNWTALLQATAQGSPAHSATTAPAPSTPPRATSFVASSSTTSPHIISPHISSSCSAASTESAAAIELKREMKAEMDDMKVAFHQSIGAMRSAVEANAAQMAQLTSTLLQCHDTLPRATPSPQMPPVVAGMAGVPPIIQGTPIVDLIDYNADGDAGPSETPLGKRRVRVPTRRLCEEEDSE